MKRNRMVFEHNFPTINQGITTLFDVNSYLKNLILNMLSQDETEEKYLYFIGVNMKEFSSYYRDVSERCEEINQIFINDSGINQAVVFPKTMFLFDNMQSYNYFRDYFEQIEDPADRVRNELAYGSTESIGMTISIFHPLIGKKDCISL